MQNYNCSCSFVWARNSIAYIKGNIQISGICEQGAEENNWAEEVWKNRSLEKISEWAS
jgi:hypothetical protein